MRVAIVHEWLVVYAGSERVLEQILKIWPEADLFSVVDFIPAADRAFLQGKKPRTTFVQHLPLARKKYRSYLPVMPMAVERLDLSAYDLVISSSHAVAKGVRTRPGQLHVSYIHSPIRYAWDLRSHYLAEAGLDKGIRNRLANYMLDRVQRWDLKNTADVDVLIANSNYIAARILRCYGREASTVYPPIDIERFSLATAKEDFYLTASRLVPYKKVPLIAEAFSRMPQRKLVVIGDGTEANKLRAIIGDAPNIQWLGYQSDRVLLDTMQRAKAFVFAAEEDFGITPLEAQACGTPVIAFGRGGSLETVRGDPADPGRTGIFFEEQTVESIVAAVGCFEKELSGFSAQACRSHAEQFSPARFRSEFKGKVDLALAQMSATR